MIVVQRVINQSLINQQGLWFAQLETGALEGSAHATVCLDGMEASKMEGLGTAHGVSREPAMPDR